MSCNGCRVLRKGCSDSCALRPCLQWIEGAEAQGHATVFVAKFFGRAGLLGFISAVPENQRPALFRSLLYEACGRTVNPVYGAVGLLWSGNWNVCSSAVETILRGGRLQNASANPAAAPCYGPMPNLPRHKAAPLAPPPSDATPPTNTDECAAAAAGLTLVRLAADSKPAVVKREREEVAAPVARRRRRAAAVVAAAPTPPLLAEDVIDLDLTLSTAKLRRTACNDVPPPPLARSSSSSEGSVTSLDTNGGGSSSPPMDLLHRMEAFHHRL